METRLQVLLVGRDPAWRRCLGELAASAGCEVLHAADGAEALAGTRLFRPSIVLVDGSGDGPACIPALRGAVEAYRPYVLVTVARKDHERMAACLELGIDDFIAQPLRRELVLARLALARQMLELRRENSSFLTQIRDYSDELASLHFRVRELAACDALTGLPNRQRAMACLEQAWADSRRADSPLACVVLLLAGLRQINHRHGHERGDVILKTVAAFLKAQGRAEDVPCRIDGNEFLLICPGTGLPAALAFGARLQERLCRTFGMQAGGAMLGLNIGVAERGADVTGAQVLVNLASYSAHRARRIGGERPYAVQSDEARSLRKVRPGALPRRRPARSAEPAPAFPALLPAGALAAGDEC